MAAAKGNKFAQIWTPELIQDLCESIISFAEEDGTVHFVEWSRRQKKSYSWLNETAKDYKEFADAYLTAKELMAGKLVKSSIYGHPTNTHFNATYAMEWKNVYSQEVKDHLKYKADLTKKELTEQEIQTVVKVIDYSKAKASKSEELK